MDAPLHSASVLIVTDDSEFARAVTARWQSEPRPPAITVVTSDVWQHSIALAYDLVISGPVRRGKSPNVLDALCGSALPAIVHVAETSNEVPALQSRYPALPIVAREEGWINALILVSCEALRRVEAVIRSQRAERLAFESRQDAALGKYMLEMRPKINDALTSMLGNADLLLLDSENWKGETREQLRAIHAMALRLHQVMQRFSSLAAEVRLGEKESHPETQASSRVVSGELVGYS